MTRPPTRARSASAGAVEPEPETRPIRLLYGDSTRNNKPSPAGGHDRGRIEFIELDPRLYCDWTVALRNLLSVRVGRFPAPGTGLSMNFPFVVRNDHPSLKIRVSWTRYSTDASTGAVVQSRDVHVLYPGAVNEETNAGSIIQNLVVRTIEPPSAWTTSEADAIERKAKRPLSALAFSPPETPAPLPLPVREVIPRLERRRSAAARLGKSR
eukprot:Opistho-1_new@18572